MLRAHASTRVTSFRLASLSGEITFTLYGPFEPGADLVCSEANEYAAVNNPPTVTVNGNGDYDSAAIHVTEAGVYTWMAEYSGDSRNLEASHACGLASETLTVNGRN